VLSINCFCSRTIFNWLKTVLGQAALLDASLFQVVYFFSCQGHIQVCVLDSLLVVSECQCWQLLVFWKKDTLYALISAVRSTAVCLHTISLVFVWFSDLRGFISMMNVEVQKQQPMGLMHQLSRQDSLSSPGLWDDRGWTPLHVAARMGDLTEVYFNPSVFDSKCVHLENRLDTLEFCRWNVWAKPKWWALKLLHCPWLVSAFCLTSIFYLNIG